MFFGNRRIGESDENRKAWRPVHRLFIHAFVLVRYLSISNFHSVGCVGSMQGMCADWLQCYEDCEIWLIRNVVLCLKVEKQRGYERKCLFRKKCMKIQFY